jgi:ATP-binding cassette subfamily B protein
MVGLTLAEDRRRAVITMLPLSPLSFGVLAVAGRQVLDGGSLTGALVAGAALAVLVTASYWQITTGAMRLAEVTGLAIDRQLLDGVTGQPTVDLFDDHRLLDRLELLRAGKQPITNAVALVRDLLWVGLSLVVSSALLVAADPRLGVLPLAVLPVAAAWYRSERITDAAEQRLAGTRREALHLFDAGTGPAEAKELRVFGQTGTIRARYRSAWGTLDAELTAAYARAAVFRVIAGLGFAVVLGGGLLYVVGHPRNQGLAPGSVFFVVVAALQLANLGGGAAMAVGQLRRALTMVEHLDAVTARVDAGHAIAQERKVAPPDRLRTGIELRGVSFRYPGSSTAALDEVDLVLPAGTSVAVVGENGAGKSTLVNLLCGLHQPTSGSVLIDGVPLAGIDADGWFERLAVVCQDYTRFEMPVRDCVGLGDVARLGDDIAVNAAVERAGATEVVAGLAAGLDTQLGARFGGVDLSGGQWQRLAVARGMLRRSPLLLVLDEPTGALDATTEQRLLERCIADARDLAAAQGTVVVYVSHRYSTVRLADCILVLDGGRVAELGSHDELLGADGRYADAYRRQAAAYR